MNVNPAQFEASAIAWVFASSNKPRIAPSVCGEVRVSPLFSVSVLRCLLLFISVPIVEAQSHSWFRRPGGIALVFSADESDSIRHCVFSADAAAFIEIDPHAGRSV